jgi:hypothetical protein
MSDQKLRAMSDSELHATIDDRFHVCVMRPAYVALGQPPHPIDSVSGIDGPVFHGHSQRCLALACMACGRVD